MMIEIWWEIHPFSAVQAAFGVNSLQMAGATREGSAQLRAGFALSGSALVDMYEFFPEATPCGDGSTSSSLPLSRRK